MALALTARPGPRPASRGRALAAGSVEGVLLAAFALLSAAGCASLRGPPPDLHGRVTDATAERAVPRALLLFEGGPRAATDDRGDYAIADIEPGHYRVLVMVTGCRSAEGVVRVPERAGAGEARPGPVPIRVRLPPRPRQAGERVPPEESRGRVITAAEIDDLGLARLSEVIRRVAPEMIGGTGGDPGHPASIRGRGGATVAGPRIPVLVVDGIVVRAVDTADLDRIAVRDVAWVEILPGAVAGWEYGSEGAGGVIRVETKRGLHAERDLEPAACPLPEGWSDPGD